MAEEERRTVLRACWRVLYTEVVDVLSTQSMRAPEVVKGIKESIVVV